jgi:AcrR family transcriptional regulator
VTTSATTDRILDAAEHLFFTDGIAVTGVDRVAERAQVAIATLYKHVGSKDRLLEAVLARRLRSWTEHWDAAVEAATSPEGRLLALFDALASYRAEAGSTQWCCFLATASERPLAAPGAEPDAVGELVARDTALLTERLLPLAEAADLEDPREVVDRLVLVHTGALASLLRGTPADPVAVARRLAEVVIAAAGRSNPRG